MRSKGCIAETLVAHTTVSDWVCKCECASQPQLCGDARGALTLLPLAIAIYVRTLAYPPPFASTIVSVTVLPRQSCGRPQLLDDLPAAASIVTFTSISIITIIC